MTAFKMFLQLNEGNFTFPDKDRHYNMYDSLRESYKPQFKDFIVMVSKVLKDTKTPYALGGGVAVGLYGSQRDTKDIDLFVDGTNKSYRKNLRELFSSMGFSGDLNEYQDIFRHKDYPEYEVDILYSYEEPYLSFTENRAVITRNVIDGVDSPFKVVSREGLILFILDAITSDKRESTKAKRNRRELDLLDIIQESPSNHVISDSMKKSLDIVKKIIQGGYIPGADKSWIKILDDTMKEVETYKSRLESALAPKSDKPTRIDPSLLRQILED